jgi:hypothetical protein
MPSEIVVGRIGGVHRDALRSYQVVIDGQTCGKVKPGQTRSFPVSDGAHTVRLKISWCSSPTIAFSVVNSRASFACVAGSQDPLVAITADKGNYISLWQTDDLTEVEATSDLPPVGLGTRPGRFPVEGILGAAGLAAALVGALGCFLDHYAPWAEVVLLIGCVPFVVGGRALRRKQARQPQR